MLGKLPVLAALMLVLLCATLVPTGSGGNWFSEDSLAALINGEEISHKLDEVTQVLKDRIRLRTQVIDKVVAGEMSLVEAASRFRAYSEAGTDNPLQKLDLLPGATQEEKLCWQVIKWAEAHASSYPNRGSNREVAARLTCELEDLLIEGNGKIELPK
jgi:hypothetical protein